MIIRDSSLHYNITQRSVNQFSGDIAVGIVRSAEYNPDIDTVFYLVEVTHSGVSYVLNCRQMAKFGDVYNYEEWGLRNIHLPTVNKTPTTYANRVGEIVVVANIGGNPNDGVIVGSLRHPARKAKLTENNVAYASEFNGLETTIDKDGAYKLKFQGTPTTVASLKSAVSSGKIPDAKYDTTTGGSYLSFDKEGSFEVNDSHSKPQSLKIDKSGGKITIVSGDVKVTLSKSDGSYSIDSKITTLKAANKFTLSTKSAAIEASQEIKIKSAKVAIGSGSVELIDSIVKLVDAIGALVVSSPVGPCSPVKSAPTWAQLEQIKTQLSSIKGSL